MQLTCNTTSSTKGDHSSRNNSLLLRPTRLIVPVSQIGRNIRLAAVDSKKQTEVADTRRLGVEDDDESDDGDDRLRAHDGPAHPDLVRDVRHR